MRLIDADALPITPIDETDLPYKECLNVVCLEDLKEAPTITQIYGHSISALIVVADLYRNKGIILEDTAKAFEAGYKMAMEEADKAIKKAFESATTFEAISKKIHNIENNAAG